MVFWGILFITQSKSYILLRFCGVSNSFVKRNASGDPGSVAPQPSKTGLGVTASSKTAGAFPAGVVPQPQPQKGRVQQPSPKLGLQASTVVSTDDKTGKNAPVVHAELGKPHTDKATAVPADKKKVQNAKTSSGAGGSLANLWGRASSKSKPSCPSAETATVTNPIGRYTEWLVFHHPHLNISSNGYFYFAFRVSFSTPIHKP